MFPNPSLVRVVDGQWSWVELMVAGGGAGGGMEGWMGWMMEE
jgi:hypothetical protein